MSAKPNLEVRLKDKGVIGIYSTQREEHGQRKTYQAHYLLWKSQLIQKRYHIDYNAY